MPVLILVMIAIPSFKLMYYMDRVPNPDMTIKVTGHQWYWSYDYPDQKDLAFDSNIIQQADLKPGQLRLLDVDNPLVVPVDTNIRVLVTSTDVIHSWFIPSFGVQEYAVIGRLNESWFNVEREGTYYGECNQICGVNHAFMPIKVVALSKAAFQTLAGRRQEEVRRAIKPTAPPVRVAALAGAGRQLRARGSLMTYEREAHAGEVHGYGAHGHAAITRAFSPAGCSRPTTRTSARSI